MKTEEEITAILVKELDYIYCHNCRGNDLDDEEFCDGCNRKSMEWELSESAAKAIAAKIITA